jgi:hypothetical protein
MDYGQQTTGTRDEHYNLISVLYHALHGAENCDRYAADAEVAGDERLAGFFRETQIMQSQIAERAKGLLGILEPRRSSAPAAAPPRAPPPRGARRTCYVRRSAIDPSRKGQVAVGYLRCNKKPAVCGSSRASVMRLLGAWG